MDNTPAPPAYAVTSDHEKGKGVEPSPQFPSPLHYSSNDHHAHPSQMQQQMQYDPTQRQSIYYPNEIQQQQPAMIPAMTVNNGAANRNALNKPFDANGEREWSFGLCGCCGDAGACCLSCWCPCMQYSINRSRLSYLEKNGRPNPSHGEACTGDCWAYGCLAGWLGLGWVLQIGSRSEVRRRYKIVGGPCGDLCTACCCTPCALTQESREIQLEENRSYATEY
ncbi:hypothetical protein FRB93_009842 [Tulasnella sp. JGI-2019a]|nr:hypothetical protein FRB93_009842 [Tulasnella sp. JGI-2019a]